jgi:hypothetical protein
MYSSGALTASRVTTRSLRRLFLRSLDDRRRDRDVFELEHFLDRGRQRSRMGGTPAMRRRVRRRRVRSSASVCSGSQCWAAVALALLALACAHFVGCEQHCVAAGEALDRVGVIGSSGSVLQWAALPPRVSACGTIWRARARRSPCRCAPPKFAIGRGCSSAAAADGVGQRRLSADLHDDSVDRVPSTSQAARPWR